MTNASMESRRGSRRAIVFTMLLLGVVVGGVVGYAIGHRTQIGTAAAHDEADGPQSRPSEDAAAAAAENKVASVQTAVVRRGSVTRTIRAYGPVVSRAGTSRVVSAAFESRVQQVLVVVGQHVDVGTPLIRVEPSPDSRLQAAESRRALAAAESDLKGVQGRIDLKLATNQDLSTAKQAVEAARLKLDSLRERGAEAAGPHEFKSESAGIVAAVMAQPGQLVAAGAPLVEVAASDQIEIRLGIPPADIRAIAPGLDVKLRPVSAPSTANETLIGHVRMVGAKVSPDTRLVDAFISPPPDGHFILDEYTEGELSLPQHDGLLVPRTALLPTEDGQILFTVKDGHAAKHVVALVAEGSNGDAQIEAKDVAEGDAVVVLGNFELEDGMKVSAQPAAARTEESRKESADEAAGSEPVAATGPTTASASTPAATSPTTVPTTGPTTEPGR